MSKAGALRPLGKSAVWLPLQAHAGRLCPFCVGLVRNAGGDVAMTTLVVSALIIIALTWVLIRRR